MPDFLLIAKLHAYGFDKNPTENSIGYLIRQKQKIKINKMFNNWENIQQWTPYWISYSLMSLFVFLFCLYQTLSYVDDNTPFAMGSSELEIL